MIYLIFRKLCVYLNNLVIFEKYQWEKCRNDIIIEVV
jgi:hypothetical protein